MAERCQSCTWEEIPNKVAGSTVKSYRVTQLCSGCLAQKELDAASEAAQANSDYKEELVAAKSRDQAIDALIEDGVLDSNGDLIQGSS